MFQIAPTVASTMQLVPENVTSHRKTLSPPMSVPASAHPNLPSMRPTTFNAALPSAYLVRLASDLKARFFDVLQHMRRWGTEGTVSSSGRGVGTCKVQARLYMLQDCTCIIRALDANIGIIGEMHDLSISLSLFVMDISRHFLHLQYIRYWPESELCGSQLLTSYSRCVSLIVFIRFSTAYFVLQ